MNMITLFMFFITNFVILLWGPVFPMWSKTNLVIGIVAFFLSWFDRIFLQDGTARMIEAYSQRYGGGSIDAQPRTSQLTRVFAGFLLIVFFISTVILFGVTIFHI